MGIIEGIPTCEGNLRMPANKLTTARIKAAIPREQPFKIADGLGLSLLVQPNGNRLWRFRYRWLGKERMLGLGRYPDTSLRLAREKRDAARALLAREIDPSAERKAKKRAQLSTFQAVATEWQARHQKGLHPKTRSKTTWMLDTFLYPHIGSKPVASLTAADLLPALRAIEGVGFNETAHRCRSLCSRVLRFAVTEGLAPRNVTEDLEGALAPVQTSNRAALTDPKRVGELLRAIEGFRGQPAVLYALRLSALLFPRPGELRRATWAEFDLDAREPIWRVPAERMKMGEPHLVPLSRQSVRLLRELQALTGTGQYLFPSLRSNTRPISDNTINAALRRLGYSKEEMTAHGFRAMASTLMHETGWDSQLIELQLAHADRNKVRAAYNRAERLKERRKMMQDWADYLDKFREGT